MNDVVGPELLKKAVEHGHCGECVIERAVRGGRRGVKMSRERRKLKRPDGRAVQHRSGEDQCAQVSWLWPRDVCAHRCSLEETNIEAGVMGDENRSACKLEEILDCLGFFWCSINIIVTDSGDIRDDRGDEPTRIDEGRKAGDFLAAMNFHSSDFDDAVLVRG